MRVIATLAFLFATPVMGQHICSKFEDDTERLKCFDAAFPDTAKTPASEPQWQVNSQTSKMTDQTNVFLSVTSTESIRCGHSYKRSRPRLFLRCFENSTAVLLSTQCHVTSGHGGYGSVAYRVGSETPKTRSFEADTSNRSLGLWDPTTAIAFISELKKADELIMRFTPYNQPPKEVVFNTTGLETALTPLREACGW
ncbi:type VI secretion system-associated protein TagO [Halovulum sp. GXIMD14793]